MWTAIAIVLITGYVLGAIPSAVIIARYHGVNIFKVGSGNPGATNVKRTLGKKAGNLCFIFDGLKGLVATAWPFLAYYQQGDVVLLGGLGLLASVLGHRFSLFIGFRGGKGVATAMGGLVALMPIVLLIGAVVWIAIFFTLRYVSVASLAFALSLPISTFFLRGVDGHLILSFILMLLLAVSHRSNLIRLVKGEESRFERKSKKASKPS